MTTMTASGSLSGPYRVDLEVDPPQPQSRLTVFFRLFMIIPHAIVLAVLGLVVSLFVLAAWFVILFTGKMPAGLANFMIGVNRWSARVSAYVFLLTGQFPAFSMDADPAYPVRYLIDPQLEGRNRLTVFFRVIMIIPHSIVLGALGYAAVAVVIIGWFAAMFTGSVPAGLHTFLAGYCRWNIRYMSYANLLVDDYPPFSLT